MGFRKNASGGNMNYRDLLFDLDGTVIDSFDGISRSYRYALEKMGREVRDEKELRRVIGPPLSESFETLYGLVGKENEEAIWHYRKYYLENDAVYACRLYDGIVDAISTLRERGYRISIATSKPEKMAKLILERMGISSLFDFIGGAEDDARRREKTDVIRYVLASLDGSDVQSTLMIGDRMYDTVGARELGIDALGVLWGFGSEQELKDSGVRMLASSPSELLTLL
jgi:phosphoglycolate phosphatase